MLNVEQNVLALRTALLVILFVVAETVVMADRWTHSNPMVKENLELPEKLIIKKCELRNI